MVHSEAGWDSGPESGDKESLMAGLRGRGDSRGWGTTRREREGGRRRAVGLTSADWPRWSVVSEGREGVKKTPGCPWPRPT